MSAQEYFVSTALIVAMMAAIALVETKVPLFTRPARLPGRRTANLG